MATTDNGSDGDLNVCAYCNQPLSIVEGSDPDPDSSGFWERYECPNGHTGKYTWQGQPEIKERFTGACRSGVGQ